MAKLKEMLDIAGSMEKAEQMARNYVQQDNSYLMDLVLLLAAQGKVDEAKSTLQTAESIFPNDDRVKYNKGWYVMMEGKLLEGFELMNIGRNQELWGNAHIGSRQPIWTGEDDIEGKHILFYSEAGLGDQIVFSRFARKISEMGAKVTLACDQGFAPIFARMPEFSSIVDPRAMLGVYHDYWIPSMYSPVSLKTQFEDIKGYPFLIPNEFFVNKYKSIMTTDNFKVGIRWLGQTGDDYINRVFDETLLFDAVDQEGVSVYSLQKDIKDKRNYPEWLIDMDDFMETWEDTMAIIANLDLVITSCTSVAHIAGSMGKPTWVIVPAMMYFIWTYPMTDNKYDMTLWYDSMRLYRQRGWKEWDEPISNIKKDLKSMLKYGIRDYD